MLAFISENSLEKSVFLPGNFSYPMVPSLYAGAAAFIFPSYLETFGHPSLEAMAAGVPLAASDIPVMREVLGEAAVYFDPHDVGAIESAVRSLLDDEDLRGRLIELGRERARSFTWSRTARETLELFQRMRGAQ
jgi:alpha-1,3-rhamnosyl/mannosyltransferase